MYFDIVYDDKNHLNLNLKVQNVFISQYILKITSCIEIPMKTSGVKFMYLPRIFVFE